MLGCLTLRRATSRRSIAVLLLVAAVAISLRSLVHARLERYHHDLVVELDHKEFQGRPALGKHTLTSGGLLVVNPDGPHPIFQLIRDAEAQWNAKRARASKTLDEAVAEYRRRYRRAPPLGFDKWWDYIIKHHVQLPDEYDEIFADIEPFWGIDPQELARAQQELEKQNGVVTFEKTDASPRLQIARSTLPPERESLVNRIINILALVREVEHDLPPLRISFSPYDNPSMLSDWRIKAMALEAAANKTTLGRHDMPSAREKGWIQACPPDSPAHLHPLVRPPSIPPLPPSSPKTFIASHRETMDPCMHPSLLTTHGQFLSHKTGPFPQAMLVPRFSHCSTLVHHDIRPPVPYGWGSDPNVDPYGREGGAFADDVPWEHKTNDRLGWRGRTTGMWASPNSWWTNGHRTRLVTLTNAVEGNVSVLHVPMSSAEDSPVGEAESMPLMQVNAAWMDVAFTDKPVGCNREKGTCDEMERMWEFLKMQERRQEGQYKFILDVDGNGWSGRFKRLMTSNALIFKATIYPEWYTSRISPWVHYVPIQVSYADLYDAVSFFRVHDVLARRIARAGRTWSRQFWRREDMTAYLYRLLLEFARITSLDREEMSYKG